LVRCPKPPFHWLIANVIFYVLLENEKPKTFLKNKKASMAFSASFS
jgi:hypothetical protein